MQVAHTGASYADGSNTIFTYDAAGRPLQASDSVGGTILNSYDLLDRLTAQSTGLGTISYQYDGLGRRTRMDAPGQASVFYGYDAASRLRSITQAPLNPVNIDYDSLGRRTLLTLPNGVSTEYQYDNASRLTALIYRNALGPLGDLTYQYDAAGNRARIGGSFARTLLPDPVPSASYDAANRQLTFGNKQMAFDLNGSLTSIADLSGVITFAWDARNRLIGLSSPAATAHHAYDALGRRISRQPNGQRSEYVYDNLDIIQELIDGTSVAYLRSLVIDEPLARNDNEYFLTDDLGNTVALTDRTGSLSAAYAYEPFGRTEVTGLSANPFQFTGRENDGNALYQYRARYYLADQSRFISPDPKIS